MTALILSAILVPGQVDAEDRLGKTPAQIVAMGYDKWYDLYTGKNGESTQGMAGANRVYANAVSVVTDQKMKSLPAPRLKELKWLRAEMLQAEQEAVEAGMALTGGGTLWVITESSFEVEAQLTIADLVAMPQKPKTSTQARFWAAAKRADAAIRENEASINEFAGQNGPTAKEAAAKVASICTRFDNAAKRIKTWPAAERGRVIWFYVSIMETVNLESL